MIGKLFEVYDEAIGLGEVRAAMGNNSLRQET